MQLARINHSRCNEYAAHTLVWVPDNYTKEDFEEIVAVAQKRYLEFLKEFKDTPAPNDYKPHGRPPYHEYPDKTVGEVQAEWAEKKRVYDEWHEKQRQAARRFSFYLKNEGLTEYWEFEPELSVDVDWGHNHSLDIDYSETDAEKYDLPGPLTKAVEVF